MINYRYGNYSWNDKHLADERFKVLFVDPNDGRCLIGEILINTVAAVYLVGEDGLTFVRRAMTQDDIEMVLGYKVELIGEWNNE